LDLIGARVDLRQELAFLDQIAFVKMQFHQLTVDPRFDRDGVISSHVPYPVLNDRNAGACDLRDHYRHWAQRRTPAACSASASCPALAFLSPGGRVAGTPDRVPRDARNDQQENSPDQSAFL